MELRCRMWAVKFLYMFYYLVFQNIVISDNFERDTHSLPVFYFFIYHEAVH